MTTSAPYLSATVDKAVHIDVWDLWRGKRIEVLEERLEDVGGLGDVDDGGLGKRFGGLRQAEHALETRGREAEDEPVDAEVFAVQGAQDGVRVWGIEIIWSHERGWGYFFTDCGGCYVARPRYALYAHSDEVTVSSGLMRPQKVPTIATRRFITGTT